MTCLKSYQELLISKIYFCWCTSYVATTKLKVRKYWHFIKMPYPCHICVVLVSYICFMLQFFKNDSYHCVIPVFKSLSLIVHPSWKANYPLQNLKISFKFQLVKGAPFSIFQRSDLIQAGLPFFLFLDNPGWSAFVPISLTVAYAMHLIPVE